MAKTRDELKKEFERLSLDDPESKGCAILLAELLRKRNTEIIWNWIDKAIQEAREDERNKCIKTLEEIQVDACGASVTEHLCVVCLENAQIILPPTMCQAHYEQWEGGYHGTKTIKQMVKEYKLFQQGESEGV